jgi:hypothetical protein
MQYTKGHEDKIYLLNPEKNVHYTQSIFGYKNFQRPNEISMKVKAEETPGSIYYIADIYSDLGNLSDRVVSFEESEKGTQVFVKMKGSRISSPIGFLYAEYK